MVTAVCRAARYTVTLHGNTRLVGGVVIALASINVVTRHRARLYLDG